MNRDGIEPRVVRWFSLGAIPMAILGAVIFSRTADGVLMRILGGFLLAAVAWRHLRVTPDGQFPVEGFAPVGGVFALFSAVAGSGGPIVAPFFLAHGLVRGAYIGTEALASAIMHVTKMTSYGLTGSISGRSLLVGALLGPAMVGGSWIGKRFVSRLSAKAFMTIVELVLVALGLLLLIRG